MGKRTDGFFCLSKTCAGASHCFPPCLSDSQSVGAINVTHHKVDNLSGWSLLGLRRDKFG